jgi:hypothetical protein
MASASLTLAPSALASKMLAEARAAESFPPWNERTTLLYQTTFPQMANWLPSAEAEQLRLEFHPSWNG